MQFILFVLILILNFFSSLSENPNNVTSIPSTVGIAKPRSLTDFSSVLYEMLTSSAESTESISGSNGVNKTKDGVMEILKVQEQAQNPYIQARGQPNRFTGNNGPANNFGAPLGSYNPQGFSRPRNPAYGNQFQNNNNYNNNNRGFGQLSDILSGVIPDSPQRGFNTRTPQQLQQPVPNYPNNYPNLNLNHGNGRNVNIPNQGFGLGDQASNENSNQSGETELPQPNSGEQGDHGAEGPVNDEGSNEEVQPNEEEPIEGNNNDEEITDNNNNEEGDEAGERVDEDGEQPEYDEDKTASTNNNDETNADEVADADESTGQEGEQDPSNDPDLAQFQNFQGGNFPGDLFPPGILSQGDLQDIQKSIEEQQKNEAEKQRAEEEAAAQSENGNGNEENEETEDEEEPEKPVESPPINNQLAPGYGGRVNHQPNLLGLNRGLTGRSRNPGLIQPYELNNAPFANRGGLVNNNGYGSDNRGDFGTGIQDYEYERPKINRGSDVSGRAPLGFRGNLPFNRNRFHPSRESNEDEDSENERPLSLRNRFANRFGRFRPRLFGNSGRYNEDLGEYGGHRANSNQVVDIRPGLNPAHNQDSLVEKGKSYLKQLFKRKDSQSTVDYDDED